MAGGKGHERRIDELYGLPLAEFVTARNALAAELAVGGSSEAAGRVRTLAKPSLSAWLVNQLYRTHSDAFEALLEAGRRLRKGQHELLAGGSAETLKEAATAEQKALKRLAGHAQTLLGNAGVAATDTTLDRARATLQAIARFADPESRFAGQLARDLEPSGFDALVGSEAPASPAPTGRPAAKQQALAPRRKQKAEKSQVREQRAAAKRMLERALRAEKALMRDTRRSERASAVALELLVRAKRDLAASQSRHERAEIRHEAARRAVAEAAELARSLSHQLAETKQQVEAARALERSARTS